MSHYCGDQISMGSMILAVRQIVSCAWATIGLGPGTFDLTGTETIRIQHQPFTEGIRANGLGLGSSAHYPCPADSPTAPASTRSCGEWTNHVGLGVSETRTRDRLDRELAESMRHRCS